VPGDHRTAAAPAPEDGIEAPPRHPRREYHVVEVGAQLDIDELQRLVDQGWELTNILKYGGMLTYHFTRPAMGDRP
jgi:hypothetical protein